MENEPKIQQKSDQEESAEWHPFEVWKNKIRPVSKNVKRSALATPRPDPENTGSWKALPENA